MDLSDHLIQLLRDHDCAVVPGFGGFVAQYRPARMHPMEHLLKPPSKSVGFNPSLKTTDGLLLNVLIRSGLSSAIASKTIDNYAQACNDRLRSERFLTIGSLGRLISDSDDTVRFVQDDDINLLRESFGLKPVQLTPVLRKVERKPRIVLEEEVAKPRRVGAWVAAASFLLIVAVGTSLYFFNDNVHQQVVGVFNDIFRVNPPEKTIRVEVPIPSDESLAINWDEVAPLPTPPLVSESPAQLEARSSPPEASLANGGKLEALPSSGYYVIVGAFSSESNAQRQLERVSASYPNSTLFKSNGLNQVGVFASDDEARAGEVLKEVRTSFEASAWLTKR